MRNLKYGAIVASISLIERRIRGQNENSHTHNIFHSKFH